MPLRDHCHPPVSKRGSWEGFHGIWPAFIVQQLYLLLPQRFVAEPRVHLGSFYEIDVATFDQPDETTNFVASAAPRSAGTATVMEAPATAIRTLDADFPEQYAYEVLIFDTERERRLVAAIEIVSPANKDRPDSRTLFVAKCLNLLRNDVCVSIIDLVTSRRFKLFNELIELVSDADSVMAKDSSTYAVTCRRRETEARMKLDLWTQSLSIGQPLPSLPIWLPGNQTVSVDLEESYELACRVLRLA